MRRNKKLFVFGIYFVLLCSCGVKESLAQQDESKTAVALFQQFETVFYTKTALLHEARVQDFVHVPFALLLSGLEKLHAGESKRVLDHSSAILVGTKNYQLPNGLGIVRSTFCYIVILRAYSDIAAYFSQPVASTVGIPVWNWTADLDEFGENEPKPSSLYVSEVDHFYLVVSNDLQEIESVVDRLVSPSREAARFLATIPEWPEMSQRSFWGYRRYRHDRINSRDAAGMHNVTPAARSLYLYSDQPQRAGVLRLRSATQDDTTADKINSAHMIPPLKLIGPGLWQSVFPLDFENKDPDPVFAVAWLFGFGQVI